MLEPIQGEGGVKLPGQNYLKQVRELCDEEDIVLILDEIQTGMGRTGKLFAYEHYDITPDIMTIAKGLGGGVPIGALLATEKVASAFQPGNHASTFGGNPFVCAAAVATLETLLEDGFILDQCNRMSAYLMKKLLQLSEKFPGLVSEVRGKGLLIGMELTRDGDMIVRECLEKGVLINCTAGTVLRFIPPLIVQQKDINRLIETLDEVFRKIA